MATGAINVEMNIAAEDQQSMFDKSKIIARRRMPTLELIHERFCRAVRLSLFNMIMTIAALPVNTEISCAPKWYVLISSAC